MIRWDRVMIGLMWIIGFIMGFLSGLSTML